MVSSGRAAALCKPSLDNEPSGRRFPRARSRALVPCFMRSDRLTILVLVESAMADHFAERVVLVKGASQKNQITAPLCPSLSSFALRWQRSDCTTAHGMRHPWSCAGAQKPTVESTANAPCLTADSPTRKSAISRRVALARSVPSHAKVRRSHREPVAAPALRASGKSRGPHSFVSICITAILRALQHDS